MTKKKIVLKDKRYLIYYTFGKADAPKQVEKASEERCESKSGGGRK
jgi:hypothetical protein